MPSSPLLEPFRTAYRNLQLLPLLTTEELEKFAVPYGQRVMAELEQVIEDCSDINNKVIFTGHRGCGKSTLLGQLKRKLDDHYFVVFFSVAELIEMSDVNHINILFAIALQMMEAAEKNEVKIKESTKANIEQWFAKRTRTEIETSKAELSAGVNLFNIIKTKLQSDAAIREEIKQEFEPKISVLIEHINTIAQVIEDATEKEILILIDDLDKLDLAVVRDIFYDHVKALFQPQLRIVFTIPIAALREIPLRRTLETETNNQLKLMEVSKLYPKPDPNNRTETLPPKQETIDIFKQILDKRIDANLVQPEIIEQMILKSGGVLRELIRLANACCAECLLQIRMEAERSDILINQEILEQALNEIRNDFATPLSKPHYDILTTVYKTLTSDHETPENEQRFLNLLHGLYILEYRNADLWYDLHPIVFDLIKRRGYLLE
jgi:nucleoside-triphosphatase THEP1